ncbi:MAG TPA: helix-turn-helix domain-containing protein [Propionicimonas sp.]|jgi:excisionase family DNA binding protein
MTDDLLDVTQAASYLGDVSTRTVYREVGRGRLRMVKVGGSTRFRRSELDRYLKVAERVAARQA